MKAQLYKKCLSLFLGSTMLVGNTVPVSATVNETQTTNENTSKETLVKYNQSSTFLVTVPKTISLDSNKTSAYAVKVEGDIASDKAVYVAPVDGITDTDEFDFYMKDQSIKQPKADVVATVTHNKMDWTFQEVAAGYEETANEIIATDLTSGDWSGTFDFEINMHVLAENEPTFEKIDDLLMGSDESYQVRAILDSEDVTDSVTWTSDNENITINKGLIETSALANVGDTATITVSANSDTRNMTSESFKVTIIDIEFEKESEKIESLDLYPGQTAVIKANILPSDEKTDVKWSTTAPSGIAIVPNKNEVTIKIADDMPIGRTYNVLATCGTYSKLLPIEIIENPALHKHNYNEEITKEATCLDKGLKTYTCDCGDSYTEDIEALGHDLKDEVILPTCTEGGYIKHSCNRCDVSYQDTETPALGHNYVDGVCDRCGDKISLMDWEYTLNEEDNTILLTKYIGEKPDVIVYDTYEFNGKTYQAIMGESHGGYVNSPFIGSQTPITSVKFEKDVQFTTPDLSYMFYGIKSLQSVDMSELDNIEVLGEDALATSASNTSSELRDVKLPPNLETIGPSALAYNEKLEEIVIPDSVTKIEGSAFSDCESLKEISLPPGLTVIENGVFYGTGLSEITIPTRITSVEEWAFAETPNLDNIYIEDPIGTEFYANTFWNSKYDKECTANNVPTLINGILFSSKGTTSSGSYYKGYTIFVPEGTEVLPNLILDTYWDGLTGGHGQKITKVRFPDSMLKISDKALYLTIGSSQGGTGRPEKNTALRTIEYNGPLDFNNPPSAPNATVKTY